MSEASVKEAAERLLAGWKAYRTLSEQDHKDAQTDLELVCRKIIAQHADAPAPASEPAGELPTLELYECEFSMAGEDVVIDYHGVGSRIVVLAPEISRLRDWLPANAELSRLRAELADAKREVAHWFCHFHGKDPESDTPLKDTICAIGIVGKHRGQDYAAKDRELTALRERLERAEGALREIAKPQFPDDESYRARVARAALQGATDE